jgi:hypothetical protein
VCVLGILLLLPAGAAAQEERTVGLSMGYPASVALLWHTTDRIAVRPEFTFSTVSTETGERDSSSAGGSVGASVLFYTLERDALSTYIAPAYTYARASAETASGLETTTRTHHVSGSFGVQYRLGERVRVFGETGVSFSSAENEAEDIFNSQVTSDRFGNRSAVGLVFYF